jgi:hypothetical protein
MTTDYIILIMNCERYARKAQYQKDGWLKQIKIPYYHVIGKPDLELPFLFDENDRILYLKVEDDYCSLPKKVIRAYEAVHTSHKYKYIFKTDDDQVLTDPTFFDRLIPQLNDEVHYGGKKCKIEVEEFSGYWEYHPELPRNIFMRKNEYCNGRFYILSITAIADLLTKKASIETEYFEDYSIGYNLNPAIKNPIFEINNDVFVDF